MENVILNSNQQTSRGTLGGRRSGRFFALLKNLGLISAIASVSHAQSTSLTIVRSNQVPFALSTQSNDAYTIEQSTDFIHWSTLNGPWKGDQIITLTNLTPGQSFFRAVEAPQTFVVGSGPGQFHSSIYSGSAYQYMSEIQFTVLTDTETVRFVWAPIGGVQGVPGEAPFPNPFEFTASLQLTNGVKPLRVAFGGSPIRHVEPVLEAVTSDPVHFPFKAGSNYLMKIFINRQQSNTNSFIENGVVYTGTLTNTYSSLPINARSYGGIWGTADASKAYTSGTQDVFTIDQTMAVPTFPGSGDGVRIFAPCAILGEVPAHQANSVLVIGDSSTMGNGEYYSFGQANVPGSGLGWVAQGAYQKLPLTHLSIGAEGLTNWLWAGTNNLRWSFLPYGRYVVDHLGGIDISQGWTFSQLTNYHTQMWLREASQGAKVYAGTVLPRTTSTDGWRTITNQTIIPSYQGNIRSNYLVWLHTVPYPLSGIIDDASQVEVDINGAPTIGGGYWKAGGTNDTGTVTSVAGGNNTRVVTVAGKEWTPNQWAGYTFWNLTQNASDNILGNTGNTIIIDQAVTPNPGDLFLISFNWTVNGSHPTQGVQTYLSTNVFPARLFTPF